MVSTNSSIDIFISNSMKYIRENQFDGIDLDWQFPAFCESSNRCSPATDAARFKILVEKFRDAIESENLPPESKFIISSSAGHKSNQIYPSKDRTTGSPTTTNSIVSTSFELMESASSSLSLNTSNISANSDEKIDLKIEFWSPILAVVLAIIVSVVIYRIKRKNAKTDDDCETKNPAHDETIYEEYERQDSEYDGDQPRRGESYYSQIYTAYDDNYAEYEEHYADYKEPE